MHYFIKLHGKLCTDKTQQNPKKYRAQHMRRSG